MRLPIIISNLAALLLLSLAAFAQPSDLSNSPVSEPSEAGSFKPPVTIDARALARLAVQHRGRVKPFTTVARESLLTLSGPNILGTSRWKPDGAKESFYSNEVMLDIWLRNQLWMNRPLIKIENHELKEKVLGVDKSRNYFSYIELRQNTTLRDVLREAARADQANGQLTDLQRQAGKVSQQIDLLDQWGTGRIVAIIPHPTDGTARWLPIDQVGKYHQGEEARDVTKIFRGMLDAYKAEDSEQFNQNLRDLSVAISRLGTRESFYPSFSMLEFEHHYQTFHPFRWAWILFLFGLIALLLSWNWQQKLGYALGWALMLGGFAFQIYGFYCRVSISGRAPVTNMYETVIWCAFGVILFAIILEAVYRCRYFLVAASPLAIVSLVLADTQPTILDPAINPLVPVLRHNGWLIIHVLTIVLSYAAFLLALGLGHIVIGFRIFDYAPKKELNLLYHFTYRALQIGVLLLAIGTVLGAVWANYSWGRFWDWDPKETWALVALLMYLVVLHGRIAGLWKGFGLAVGAVLCFQAVIMAWYGVNFVLGKGLHSYGFGTGGFGQALGFLVFEIVFVAIGITFHYYRLKQEKSGNATTSPVRQPA